MTPERIVFAGSPAFAATILEALLAAGAPLVGVLTQPDRPAGRGRRLTPPPVKVLAEGRALPVAQPPGLRRPANRAALEAFAPDLLVVAAYGLILPPEVLAGPRHGCLNVHASCLPRWRGAAPVERAILAGDRETGVSIMQMDAGLDTGPVRLERRRAIGELKTGGELEAALATLGAEALLEVLGDLDAPAFRPVPQPDEGACYAPKLTRADARADFTEPAETLARRVRALNPRLPVTVGAGEVRVRLLLADHEPDDGGAPPGTILSLDRSSLRVACGAGVLRVLRAQVLRGKARELDAAGLANGFAALLAPGARLHGL
ncbi:MAG: methionyl-tRNA formyltransferase [Pseudomonadales bacterium]|nr:methionyl-tRNA formyltransferase [Pseudomonadales bacterium]